MCSISSMAPPGGAAIADAREQLRLITRAMVMIYMDQFGRGPATGHSHYAGPDALVCMLEGTLTPGEKTLVRIGEIQRMQDVRQLFHATAENAFRAAVESITGRKVIAFMSGNDVKADIVSEVFVFERPSRAVEEPTGEL
jgi:uncharacterized protein YbcI